MMPAVPSDSSSRQPATPRAPKGWTALTLGGIGAWIGVTLIAATRVEPGDDQLVTNTFAIAGAVFFTLVFGFGFIQLRRSSSRVRTDLYERLAVRPVSREALRASVRGSNRIAAVYLSFGAVVTALGLLAIAARDEMESRLLVVIVVIVVVWMFVAVWALTRSFVSTSAVFAPLGLTLTGTPEYRYSVLARRGWMSGAMTYAGERHGRLVEITHEADRAVTVIRPVTSPGRAPQGRAQMAALTGEPASAWKHVAAAVEDDAVVVVREVNGAGTWFLHDLLLAESVAARG